MFFAVILIFMVIYVIFVVLLNENVKKYKNKNFTINERKWNKGRY